MILFDVFSTFVFVNSIFLSVDFWKFSETTYCGKILECNDFYWEDESNITYFYKTFGSLLILLLLNTPLFLRTKKTK